VLLCLTGLAAFAIAAPGSWVVLWKTGVRSMAVAAPLLAVARIARSVALASVEREFEAWFQPDIEPEAPVGSWNAAAGHEVAGPYDR
jgi:hypothetical protein